MEQRHALESQWAEEGLKTHASGERLSFNELLVVQLDDKAAENVDWP